MLNTMDLVKIKWLDAMSDDNTWQELSELRQQQLRPVETVGWILTDFGGKIVTVSSYDEESKTCGGGVVSRPQSGPAGSGGGGGAIN